MTVAAGGLSITTPYAPDNPFDLGTMVLNSSGTEFRASENFPAAGDRLMITEFTGAGTATIDSSGLAFTSVTPGYITGNALNAATKPVVTTNVPSVKACSPLPHGFTA